MHDTICFKNVHLEKLDNFHRPFKQIKIIPIKSFFLRNCKSFWTYNFFEKTVFLCLKTTSLYIKTFRLPATYIYNQLI